MTREDVYKIINDEREYQETFNVRELSVGEELCLLQCYLDKAMTEYANTQNVPSEPAAMGVVRKIAAMCVRAMEHHGTPRRFVDWDSIPTE